MQIPWPITHGNLVWGVGLALLLLLSLWLAVRGARRRAHLLQKELREGSISPVGAECVNQVVTLEGILRSEESCERLEDGAAAALSTAWGWGGGLSTRPRGLPVSQPHGALWLEVSGARVLLDGAPVVQLGSREVAPRTWRWLGKRLRARVERAARGLCPYADHFAVRFASLRPGARVQARGRLEQRPVAERSHREHAGDWVLRPEGDHQLRPEGDHQLRLVCVDPVSVRAMGGGWLARVVLGGVLGFLVLASSVGEVAYRAGEVSGVEEEHPGTMWYEPHELVAAATPWRRPRILRRLAYRAARPSTLDREGLETAVTLNQLADRCEQSIELLLEHGEAGRAVAQWRQCPGEERSRLLASAYYNTGQLDRASAVLAQDPPGESATRSEVEGVARVHLLAGQYRHAARVTRQLARLEQKEQRDWVERCKDPEKRREYPALCKKDYRDRQSAVARARNQRLRCVALALEAMSGKEDAAEALEERTKQSTSCRLLLAGRESAARDRLPGLTGGQARWDRQERPGGTLPWGCRLSAMSGYLSQHPAEAPLLRAAAARLRAGADTGTDTGERLLSLVSFLVPLELALGRHAEARRLARELVARTAPPPEGPPDKRRLEALHCQAAVELVLGQRDAAKQALAQVRGTEESNSDHLVLLALTGGELSSRVLWRLSIPPKRVPKLEGSSAARIHRLLWRWNDYSFSQGQDFRRLLVAVSRLRSGRELLKPWTRRRGSLATRLVHQRLGTTISYFSERQLAALQVKDRERARRLGQALRRFNAAITRERALPLMLLER